MFGYARPPLGSDLWPRAGGAAFPGGSGATQSAKRTKDCRSSRGRLQFLIAAQIALSLLLLAATVIAASGFLEVMHAALGYEPKNVLQVSIFMRLENPNDGSAVSPLPKRVVFVEQIRQKIE